MWLYLLSEKNIKLKHERNQANSKIQRYQLINLKKNVYIFDFGDILYFYCYL